jgi:capsular exopolysaccharide synthesis family protein
VEIRNYSSMIWRRKTTILLTLIVTLSIVLVGIWRSTPIYEATAILRVAVSAGGSLNYSDYMYADRLINTYINIATSRQVLEELEERLDLLEPPAIKAEVVPSTELIKITAEHADPVMAARIANTAADVLVEQSSHLYIGGGKSLTEVLAGQLEQVQTDLQKAQDEYEILLAKTPAPESIESTRQLLQLKQNNYAELLSQYEQARFREEIQSSMITIFESAEISDTPSKPQVLLNLILGLAAGMIGGFGLALLLENFDTTLYQVDKIEAAVKLPVLVKIPKASKKEITAVEGDLSSLAESFRQLVAVLQETGEQKRQKVLLLASAEPNQGKSMITYRLACALTELGVKVVAVDCDARRPKLHTYFQIPNELGLKDILENKTELKDALQTCSVENVWVLTSGSRLAHPSHMLSSVQMNKVMESLRKDFDYVLLDSPAMLAVADVAALIPHADGVLLVVRQSHAKFEAVREVGRNLKKLKDKFIGLVVNQSPYSNHYSYYRDAKKSTTLISSARSFYPIRRKKHAELRDQPLHRT